MLRIKLFRILYGDDNCDYFIQKLNKDCLNNITAFLCIGFTLNNETINSIKLIQDKPYTFQTFRHNLCNLINDFDTLHDKISKIKQSEILYRYINMYYAKAASYRTSRFTQICYNKAIILQEECSSVYETHCKKYTNKYNTRSKHQHNRVLELILISQSRFIKEAKEALVILENLKLKYTIIMACRRQ